MSEKWDLCDVLAMCVLCLIIGGFSGAILSLFIDGTTSDGINSTRLEAIENGAGEWRADPKTGAVEFVWLKRD